MESTTSRGAHEEVTFDAMRQFVVAPDRRYRVECRDGSLAFFRTGSQFDVQWLVRGARPFLGDRIAGAFERSSRRKLVLGGIAVAAVAALLLGLCGAWMLSTTVPLRGSHFRGLAVLFFVFVVGLIMIIAGIATQREGGAGRGHDLSLSLSDVVGATLLPPQSELARRGEPQVARLQLQPRSGRAIRLGIPTAADLETVRSVVPGLAPADGEILDRIAA